MKQGGARRTASLRGRGTQAEGAGRAREGLGRGAAGLLEGRGRHVGDMSGGSSCSQTPSRAIPTRRVALGDGVQLPPGDYSTTPGGTLFSTTPGGRRGPGVPGDLRDLEDTQKSGVACATGVAALGGIVAGKNGQGASGRQEGHRLGCLPSGAWSGDRAANCRR
ncbi:Eukaryotic translation initiation factor 4E-binding protein 1 [Lemmus lemmus]